MGWWSFWGLRSECCGALPDDEPTAVTQSIQNQTNPILHKNNNSQQPLAESVSPPVSRLSDRRPVSESIIFGSRSSRMRQPKAPSGATSLDSDSRRTLDASHQRAALFNAVETGNLEQLHLLFTNPTINASTLLLSVSDVNEYRTAVDTVIHLAGNEITETPLAAWYLKNEGKTDGVLTPLHIAARQGHADVITRVLRILDTASEPYNAGMVTTYCNKTTSASEGLTPLHLALYAPAQGSSQRPVQEVYGTGARKLLQDLMSLNNMFGNRHACVEVLLAHGARVDAQAEIPGLVKCKGTALHMAAVNFCDAESMRLLLAAGADVNAMLSSDDHTLNGSTVLHLTLRIGLLYDDPNVRNALPLLIQKGADPWVEGPEGNAMHIAAKYGTGTLGAEVLRKLVTAMVMVSKGELGPSTPPMSSSTIHQPQVAGRNGLPSLLPRLGRQSRPKCNNVGEAINIPNFKGETPLQLAACNPDGSAEVVCEVMDLGADLRGTPATAALMAAMDAVVDDLSKVKAMLERGIDSTRLLEVPDSKVGPLNPVQWVFLAAAGHCRTSIADRDVLLELLKLTLEFNTKLPDIPIGAGCAESPMLFALRRFDLQFLGFVIVAGEDLNDCYEVGPDGSRANHSPLIAILEREDIKDSDALIKLLVQVGADPSRRSQVRNGASALHMLRNGMESLVLLLTQGGCDVNQADDNMDTPLMAAVQRGDVFIARMLMMQAANVTIINKQGRSALHLLCRNPKPPEHISMARSLLKAGADPAAPDNDGCTPMDYARRSGDEELIQLIEKYCHLREAQAARSQDKHMAAAVAASGATPSMPSSNNSSMRQLQARAGSGVLPAVKRPSQTSLRPPSIFENAPAAAVVGVRGMDNSFAVVGVRNVEAPSFAVVGGRGRY